MAAAANESQELRRCQLKRHDHRPPAPGSSARLNGCGSLLTRCLTRPLLALALSRYAKGSDCAPRPVVSHDCQDFIRQHGECLVVAMFRQDAGIGVFQLHAMDGTPMMWGRNDPVIPLYPYEYVLEPFLTAVRKRRQQRLRRDTSNQPVARRVPGK